MAAVAMTVSGPIDPRRLGVTLLHEHLHMDATPMLSAHGYETSSQASFCEIQAEARWNPGAHPDNYRLTDGPLVADELRRFRDAGGRTVVDVTPDELGRDPLALRRIAEATGLHVVMGGGHYVSSVHPPDLASRDEDAIADRLVAEWRDGVADTGIKPGIIGEIGTSDPLDPVEGRVLRGAARAARQTGLTLSIHLQPWGSNGDAVLDIVLAEGLSPERVVLGHLTTAHDDVSYLHRLLGRGVSIAFDLFGFDHSLLGIGRYPPSDADVSGSVIRLIRSGHADQITISQDVGVRTRLIRHGGWGYGHLLRNVVPLLAAGGLTRSEVDRLLVDNPRRLLTVEGIA